MLNDVLFALQVILAFIGSYQLALTLFGWYRRKTPSLAAPQKSFAILVAAHNEEQVLAPLLENLSRLDYPKDLYDVFVICDNCTDRTADVARSCGAYAFERTNPALRGKGYAIEWMLKELWKLPRSYDSVVMFDADNLMKEDFLLHMNNDLLNGAKVIQAYLDTKNPHDSWVTAAYAVTYWNSNRLSQLPRQNLRLANVLGGTGMCFEAALLREMGWGATSLVEDLEFTMRCVKRGVYPIINYDAKVYDEKVLTFRASVRQRLRWMQGHFEVARRYFFPLLWSGLKEANWVKIDAAIYSLNVYNVFIGTLITFAVWIDMLIPGSPRMHSLYTEMGGWIGYLPLIVYVELVLSLIAEKAPLRIYKTLILYPIFMVSWWPITVYAFFTQNNKRWSHTEHTRVLRLEDLKGEQA